MLALVLQVAEGQILKPIRGAVLRHLAEEFLDFTALLLLIAAVHNNYKRMMETLLTGCNMHI